MKVEGSLKALLNDLNTSENVSGYTEMVIYCDVLPVKVTDWEEILKLLPSKCPRLNKIVLSRKENADKPLILPLDLALLFSSILRLNGIPSGIVRNLQEIDVSAYQLGRYYLNNDDLLKYYAANPGSQLKISCCSEDYNQYGQSLKYLQIKGNVNKDQTLEEDYNSWDQLDKESLLSTPLGSEASKPIDILSALVWFFDRLFGAIVGLVLGVWVGFVIYNPITVFLSGFNVSPKPETLIANCTFPFLRMAYIIFGTLLSPFAILFFAMVGIENGGRDGLKKAVGLPQVAWDLAHKRVGITTANVFTPWLLFGLAELIVVSLLILVTLGWITLPVFIPFTIAFVTTGAFLSLNGLMWLGIGLASLATAYLICQIPPVGRFLDMLSGLILGPIVGLLSALVIHNPLTCLLGALDVSHWQRYGIPLNLLRIIISPVVFPIVALFDHVFHGLKVGYNEGFSAAIKVPVFAWVYAPYYTSEILLPWIAVGIAGMTVAGLLYAGVFALSTAVSAVVAYVTVDALLSISVTATVAGVLGVLYEGIQGIVSYLKPEENLGFYQERTAVFKPYIVGTLVEEAVDKEWRDKEEEDDEQPGDWSEYQGDDAASSREEFVRAKPYAETPKILSDFFALPPSLSNANVEEGVSRTPKPDVGSEYTIMS